jgi:hypothetical protein
LTWVQPKCKFCNAEISWDKVARANAGIKGPLNLDGLPHNCRPSNSNRGNSVNISESVSRNTNPKEIFCNRGCGQRITFDVNVKSESGKLIPLNFDTKARHDCPKNPYNKQKREEEETYQANTRKKEMEEREAGSPLEPSIAAYGNPWPDNVYTTLADIYRED